MKHRGDCEKLALRLSIVIVTALAASTATATPQKAPTGVAIPQGTIHGPYEVTVNAMASLSHKPTSIPPPLSQASRSATPPPLLAASPTSGPGLNNSWEAYGYNYTTGIPYGGLAQNGWAADPHLAVSYTHVVVTARAAFAAYTKSGLLVWGPTDGKTFFTANGIPDHGSTWNITDMRIVYDEYRQRFFMTTLYAGAGVDGEQLLVAVSKSTDPNQGWWIYSLDMPFHSSSPPPAWHTGDSCDYDSIGVGPTVYLMTANWWASDGMTVKGSDVYMFDANAMANGISPAGWIFYNLTNPDGHTPVFGMQPAVHHGSTGSKNTVWLATKVNSNAAILFHVDNPLQANQAVFENSVSVTANGLAFIPGPQKGVTNPNPPPLDMGNQMGDIFLKAAWRNNKIYLTSSITVTSGFTNLAAARLFRINTSTFTTEIDQTIGIKSATDPFGSKFHYGWPAAEANTNGDMVIATSRTSSNIFPEIRVSQWLAGESTIESDFLLKSGEAPYHEAVGSACGSGSWVCWGETTGVSVDPTDDTGIWVTFEYPVPVPAGKDATYMNHSLWVGQILGSGCGHGVCVQGQPIPQSCDGICVNNVCNADPYCCNNWWDGICVSEVPTYCAGATCDYHSP